MIDLSHLRVLGKIFNDLQCVLYVTLYAQWQRLSALKKNPCVERRDSGASVTKDDGTNTCDESCRTCNISEDGTVIRWVWLSDCRILVSVSLPIELATVNDNAAEGRAVTTDELCSGMNHDVGTMLQWTNHDRCEGVVNDEHDVVTVSYLCHSFEIGDIRVRVSECLGIDHLGVRLYSLLKSLEVIDIDDSVCHALVGKSVGDEVEAATVEVVGCNDVVTCQHYVLQCVSHCCCATGNGETCHATLESRDALLEDTLSRVCETAVDVACVTKTEAVCSVLRVTEYVRSGLIYRHCA